MRQQLRGLAVVAMVVTSTAGDNLPPGYDLDEALRCVTLSSIAYCIESIMPWTCPYCKNSTAVSGVKPVAQFTNTSTDTHGYVAVDIKNETIYIVFRGTEDLRNWITDLNGFGRANFSLPMCGSTSVLVHEGFSDAYESVRPQILTVLHQLARDGAGDYNVVVAGHSLGAALATLAAVDLVCGDPGDHRADPWGNISMYNYGSPRVGDVDFYSLVSKTLSGKLKVLRHTHWRDPIPHLPPTALNYQHIAREYFLDEYWSPPYGNHTVHECNGSGEDPSCCDQFYIDLSVDDHLSYLGIGLGHSQC